MAKGASRKKPVKRQAKQQKVRYKRACPNCGSQNFGTVGTDLTFLTGSASHTYVCYSCGYKSRIFPMMSPRELSRFKAGARPVPRPTSSEKASAKAPVKAAKGRRNTGKKAAAAAAGIGLLYFLGIGGFIIVAGFYLTYRGWKRKHRR